MARIMEPSAKAKRAWRKWVDSRPPAVKALAERFDPWSLFLLKTTGQRVVVASYSEDGTVSVNVLAAFNAVLFERTVFGINPDDLEPCDLPAPDEALGALLSSGDVQNNIDLLRCAIRPDLFVMGADGKAVRRQ